MEGNKFLLCMQDCEGIRSSVGKVKTIFLFSDTRSVESLNKSIFNIELFITFVAYL